MDGSTNDILYLLFIGLMTYCVTYAAISVSERNIDKESKFSIKSNRGLFQLPLFWLGITPPICIGILLGAKVWLTRSIEFSPSGFENFLHLSKLPFSVVAIAIPIAAAVARAHATQQTADQFNELLKKNNKDSYENQRNNFLTHFKEIGLGIESYRTFYNNSSNTNGSSKINEELVLRYRLKILGAMSIIRIVTTQRDSSEELDTNYVRLIKKLISINKVLSTVDIEKKSDDYFYYEKEGLASGNVVSYPAYPLLRIRDLVEITLDAKENFNKLCEFSGCNDTFHDDDSSVVYCNYFSKLDIQSKLKVDSAIRNKSVKILSISKPEQWSIV